MERRRVVITGLGAITPVGRTAEESWQAVKDGLLFLPKLVILIAIGGKESC